MVEAVGRFQFMVQDDFMAAVADLIEKQVPAPQKPAFEQRLAWFRAIGQSMK